MVLGHWECCCDGLGVSSTQPVTALWPARCEAFCGSATALHVGTATQVRGHSYVCVGSRPCALHFTACMYRPSLCLDSLETWCASDSPKPIEPQRLTFLMTDTPSNAICSCETRGSTRSGAHNGQRKLMLVCMLQEVKGGGCWCSHQSRFWKSWRCHWLP